VRTSANLASELPLFGRQNTLVFAVPGPYPSGGQGPTLQTYRQLQPRLSLPSVASESVTLETLLAWEVQQFLASRFPNVAENRLEQISWHLLHLIAGETENVSADPADNYFVPS
jgi:hypothetical protein